MYNMEMLYFCSTFLLTVGYLSYRRSINLNEVANEEEHVGCDANCDCGRYNNVEPPAFLKNLQRNEKRNLNIGGYKVDKMDKQTLAEQLREWETADLNGYYTYHEVSPVDETIDNPEPIGGITDSTPTELSFTNYADVGYYIPKAIKP